MKVKQYILEDNKKYLKLHTSLKTERIIVISFARFSKNKNLILDF